MENYKQIYGDFIVRYIEEHSPFRVNEFVRIKQFHTKNEYLITRIVVDLTGEFNYEASSPRTHARLPQLFLPSQLDKID